MSDVLELLTRRADLAPATADRDARTVEVIWSTGAPVRRRDMAGEYIERLSLDATAVDLSRLEGGSVLDAHRQSAVRDVLGSVRKAAVDGRRGTALIQFSRRPEVEPIWQDVLAGILRHVSVGYTVEEWAESKENGARVLTAVRWTPHEISLVPTPADPGAKIRMENDMTQTDTKAAEAPPATETQTRAAVNAEIRSIARIAGLDQSWVDGQIDAEADADAARRAAFEALAHRSSPAIRTEQVRVDAYAYYQPVITDFSDARVSAGSNLDVALVGQLALITGFRYAYNSQPAPGVEKSDMWLRTGLRFTF